MRSSDRRTVFCCAALAVALVLLTRSRPACADDTFFAKDTTIRNGVNNSVSIGYASEKALLDKKGTSPTVRLVGGTITGNVFTWNRSVFLIQGGTLADEVMAMDNSKIILSGGSATIDLVAEANSVVEVRGGSVQGLYTREHGTVNIRGGKVKEIFVSEQGTLNIYGVGLTKKVAETLGSGGSSVTRYTLSGRLADGTVVDSKILLVVDNSGAKLNLINAPAAPAK